MSKTIQQWEYQVANWKWKPGWGATKFEDKLNEFGKDGWELVSVEWWGGEVSATVVLKRPK